MEENTELEEGEACYYKDDDDDDDKGNIDLESLSYIDEKIQHLLGHFKKDFEGGHAVNSGPKFGGYGSFLPTHERSPCISSNPKTPQRNDRSPKSPIKFHKEDVSHNRKAPSDVTPFAMLGNASHSSHSFHGARAASADDSVKSNRGISSNDVAGRCTLKDDSRTKTGNSSDQRTLKFRIKMNSNILVQKNAEIYSGLGLDDSPSSSMGSSPAESERMLPVSQKKAEDSPTGIIQVMTSLPVPGGVLTSPLHESLLNLIKNEKVTEDIRHMSSLNGHQEPCSMSTDESDSLVGNGNLKKRTVRQHEKRLELKHMSCSENDMALHMKKRLGNRTPDREDFFSNDLKWTPLSSSICDAGATAEVMIKASEVSKEVNENRVQRRIVSVEALKGESLESVSGQDFEKIEKLNAGNGFMKNVLEDKLENSYKDSSAEPKNNDKHNPYMISKKVERDAVICKIDKKHKTHQKVKAVSEGKNKSKVDQSPGKPQAVAIKDSFGGANNALATDKGSGDLSTTSRSKMNKTKSLKDNKVRDSNKDSLKGNKSERKIDGPHGNSALKNANINNEKQSAFRAKVKKRPNGNKVVNQLLAEPCIEDASGSFPMAENNPAPETIPSVAAPLLIAEDWVCCDSCHTWRLLPTGLKPDQLPEKWLCSMLNWLPGMNSCEFSQDETTKALYASYQEPISEGPNSMQTHATGTAIGVSSADASQFGLNHKMSSSDVLPDGVKKKHVVKEKTMSGINNDVLQFSNSAKINAQVSGNNRTLNGMNQEPADSNPVKKMSSKQSSRFNNMIEEKHVAKQKDKPINEGDRKHIKLKRKMDTDQYRSGTYKKSKTENVCYADKKMDPGMGLEKMGLYARNDLPAKATRKDMRKYDEYRSSQDGDQAQVSSGGGFLDVKNSSKNDGLMKKRKVQDWVDNEKHNSSHSFHGDKQCGEEGNEGKFRKEKKHKLLNDEVWSVVKGDDNLTNGGMRQVCLSDSRDQFGTEVRYVDKGHRPRKHRQNIASHRASDGMDPLGKNLGSGQLPLAATSSSSKVSGSLKAKTNFDDVRGSPVESVTSSPLRACNLDKHIFTVGDISVKDGAAKGGLSSVGSRRSVDYRQGKLSIKLEDQILYNSHPVSHKLSSIEYRVGEAKDRAKVQGKTSSEVKNNHLLKGGVPIEQYGDGGNGMHHEEKVNEDNQQNDFSCQKSDKITSLNNMEKNRRSGSPIGTDKMKASASENCYSKDGRKYDSAVDLSYHASGPETRNHAKYCSSKFKCETDNISQKSSLRHGSIETGKQTELKQKDTENSVLKMGAQCSTDKKTISQQKTQDGEEENTANHVGTESRDGKSIVLSSAGDEIKRKTHVGSRTLTRNQKGDMSIDNADVSGKGDVIRLMRNSANGSSNLLANCSSVNFAPDHQLTVSNPLGANSSQTDIDTLDEAIKLKDRADHYKNSGFDFESNETYFQAGLKFLYGASRLESSHSESSKNGEMSNMQIYVTAAKLLKSCAHAYESRQEMATAALAYKCMEVAYMRVVYCKHSSTSRDLHELQTTLQMIFQGESPSSSASDVDNLNIQVAVDKTAVPKVINAHVVGNQVISARTRLSLVKLLDFTQYMHFAMEASRKCESAFTAASNVIMEEARKRECITSIRRVIDFSFQDVDELIRLVSNAIKAISHAGLGGARD